MSEYKQAWQEFRAIVFTATFAADFFGGVTLLGLIYAYYTSAGGSL